MNTTLKDMFHQLLRAEGQSRAAKSVEWFGWLILLEAPFIIFAPHATAALLHLPEFTDQGANFFRLVGLLVGGLGMLYVVSGRLNAHGFVFASLLDRPLVPVAMALLWYFEIVPGPLALAFTIQDFGSFLWTIFAWHADARKNRERQDAI